MALQSGRVGVRPDQVTPDGIIRHPAPYELPVASADTLGGVKVGDRLSINENGVLSASDQSYTLPTASAETLGGVKVGAGLSINSETGALSVEGGGAGIYLIKTIIQSGRTWTVNRWRNIVEAYKAGKTLIAEWDDGTGIKLYSIAVASEVPASSPGRYRFTFASIFNAVEHYLVFSALNEFITTPVPSESEGKRTYQLVATRENLNKIDLEVLEELEREIAETPVEEPVVEKKTTRKKSTAK